MSMPASLRALLSGIIDYAGLFPPASLALEQAFRNYAQYRQEPENWMLGRFLCKAADLPEVSKFTDLLATGPPFAFSVIGLGGSTGGAFACGLLAEEAAIYRFRHKHKERVLVDRFEALMPVFVNAGTLPIPMTSELAPGRIASNLVHKVGVIVGQKRGFALLPFLEVPVRAGWRAEMSEVIAAIASRKKYPTGFKLRCGGTTAVAVPSPEQVAFVIAACRDAGIPLKFTAGLHHPLRHHDAALNAKVHGFINVFVAGVLAHRHQLTEEQILPILEEEDASNFAFSDEALRWRDFRATVEVIEEVRQQRVISFGSCSFDEPREHLRKLGWIP